MKKEIKFWIINSLIFTIPYIYVLHKQLTDNPDIFTFDIYDSLIIGFVDFFLFLFYTIPILFIRFIGNKMKYDLFIKNVYYSIILVVNYIYFKSSHTSLTGNLKIEITLFGLIGYIYLNFFYRSSNKKNI